MLGEKFIFSLYPYGEFPDPGSVYKFKGIRITEKLGTFLCFPPKPI